MVKLRPFCYRQIIINRFNQQRHLLSVAGEAFLPAGGARRFDEASAAGNQRSGSAS